MCAIGHPERRHACVAGHQQIVSGVADHQRCLRRHAELGHQFLEHLRMRLGMALVRAARGMEARTQAGDLEGPIQPLARLARRYRKMVASPGQFLDQFRRAIEQQQILVAQQIVVAITLRDIAVALRRQIRQGVAQGVDQAETDDVLRPLVRWRLNAEILRRGLDAGDDGTRRIHQSTVPVEDNQFKSFGHNPFFSFGRYA